jgi:hypothetical protein
MNKPAIVRLRMGSLGDSLRELIILAGREGFAPAFVGDGPDTLLCSACELPLAVQVLAAEFSHTHFGCPRCGCTCSGFGEEARTSLDHGPALQMKGMDHLSWLSAVSGDDGIPPFPGEPEVPGSEAPAHTVAGRRRTVLGG